MNSLLLGSKWKRIKMSVKYKLKTQKRVGKIPFVTKFINFSTRIGVTHFSMNTNGKLGLKVSPKIWWKKLWPPYFVIWITYLKASSLIYQWHKYSSWDLNLRRGNSELTSLQFYAALFTASSIAHTFLYWKKNSFISLWNALMDLENEIEEKSKGMLWLSIDKITRAFTCVCITIGIVKFCSYLIRPNQLLNSYALLPQWIQNWKLSTLILATFDSYVGTALLLCSGTIFILGLAYLGITRSGLKFLTEKKFSKFSAQLYKKLELLNILFSEFASGILTPTATVLGGILWLFPTYLVFSARGKIDPHIYLIFVITLVTETFAIYYYSVVAAGVNTMSSSLLQTWKSEKLFKEEVRVLQTLRPLGIRVQDFYIVKKSTPATYFKILFDILINILLGGFTERVKIN